MDDLISRKSLLEKTHMANMRNAYENKMETVEIVLADDVEVAPSAFEGMTVGEALKAVFPNEVWNEPYKGRTNPYCADCHRKYENERQRERIARKEQKAINEVLNKISAEIKELPELHCIQVMDREDIPLLALDIIEKYKGDKE